MAEASERSGSAQVQNQLVTRPEGNGIQSDADARPGDDWVPSLEAPQIYRPLSLLAMLGLGLGILFGLIVLVGGLTPFARFYSRWFILLLGLAPVLGGLGAILARQRNPERILTVAGLAFAGMLVLIGVGGLVAFSSTAPWMLDWWAWVLLIAAVLVNWLALSRIRAAEGTLAGRDLARVGLWCSLAFGAIYFLYMAGNLLAVREQGQAATDRFMDLLRKGELAQAFTQTLKPGSRPEGSDLERIIEIEYNTPRGVREPGQYTVFRTSEMAQFMRQGGNTTFRRSNANSEFTPNGYKVVTTYDVSNDLANFQTEVTALSQETPNGRQWHIALSSIKGNLKPTQRAQDLGIVFNNALGVVGAWLGMLDRNPEIAYLATLPNADRRRLEAYFLLSRPEIPAVTGVAGRGALANLAADRQEYEQGYKSFLAGKALDDSQLFADAALRAEVKNDLIRWINRKIFNPVSGEAMNAKMPDFKIEGEEIEIAWPARVMFIDPAAGGPRLTVDGDVVCRAPRIDAPPSDYRIVGFRMKRAVQGIGGPKKAAS